MAKRQRKSPAERKSRAASAENRAPTQQGTPALEPPEQFATHKTDGNYTDPSPKTPFTVTQATARKLSSTQKILIMGLAITSVLLVYSLIQSSNRPPRPTAPRRAPSPQPMATSLRRSAARRQVSRPELDIIEQSTEEQQPVLKSAPAEPLSLKTTEELYLSRQYNDAYNAYNRLRQDLLSPDDGVLRAALQLKMALCLAKGGDLDAARDLLRPLCRSESPVIRAVANYYTCLLDIENGRFLTARTAAYRTLALSGAFTFDWNWALALQRQCEFLVAETLTRQVLSLTSAEGDMPTDIWSPRLDADPLIGLDQTELRTVLQCGLEELSKGVLGPQISPLGDAHPAPISVSDGSGQAQDPSGTGSAPGAGPRSRNWGGARRFSVAARGAPVEELLSKLADNVGRNMVWSARSDGDISNPGQTQQLRRRPVTIYMPAATTQQAVVTAAGSAGLLAVFNQDNIAVLNPVEYASLTKHTSILTDQAIRLWQKLLLTYYDDPQVPTIHFALGVLQGQKGRVTEALAEYKLVANRFAHTPLAPFALFRSSKLKAALRDYPGARTDLELLIEQYPDTELLGEAYLHLAETTRQAALYPDAAKLYTKVYNLALSKKSQQTAALGAGKCLHQTNDFEAAAKWLIRYIRITEELNQALPPNQANANSKTDLSTAYFLLGESCLALGNLESACRAFEHTLAAELSRNRYIQTISALVETQIRQDNFVDALRTIENMRHWPLSQDESTRITLLRSRVLRSMGLIDEAVTILGDKAQFLTNSQLRTELSLELAKCHIDQGKLELAHSKLADTLTYAEPGPLANEIALTLAKLCLRLGRSTQTISICSQLLDSHCPAAVEQQARLLIADAYTKNNSYDKALLALLGKIDDDTITRADTRDSIPGQAQ